MLYQSVKSTCIVSREITGKSMLKRKSVSAQIIHKIVSDLSHYIKALDTFDLSLKIQFFTLLCIFFVCVQTNVMQNVMKKNWKRQMTDVGQIRIFEIFLALKYINWYQCETMLCLHVNALENW